MNSFVQGLGVATKNGNTSMQADEQGLLPGKALTRVNVEASPVNLLDLHQQVYHRRTRVELATHDGSVCVLISKSELDALEEALEILSDSSDVREMRDHLARVATVTSRPA
jgi:PHD/YefM family antitoxin component YafN of YafNO toxin-antitoxin module